MAKDYADILKRAEKDTLSISDPELRKIAFGKLVDHLLGDGKTGISQGKNPKRFPANKTVPKAKTSTGPKAWLLELIEENFFKTLQSSKSILEELENRSHHLKASDLTRPLESLCHEKRLRRKRQEPKGGGKPVFHWSNW